MLVRASRRQLEKTHRGLLAGLSACYMAALINAQVSGDLGVNIMIGMFGAATTSVSNLRMSVYRNDE
jgi:hypothetical protein